VYRGGSGYCASISGRHLGTFPTPQAASDKYEQALAGKLGVPVSEVHMYTRRGKRLLEYVVDDVFVSEVAAHRWYDNGTGYARRSVGRRHQYMHHFVWSLAGRRVPPGMEIDHVNRNRADNRLENLRVTTRRGNLANRTSSHVRKRGDMRRWQARVTIEGGLVERLFDSEVEARAWVAESKAAYIARQCQEADNAAR
jgi:hypothetical protein